MIFRIALAAALVLGGVLFVIMANDDEPRAFITVEFAQGTENGETDGAPRCVIYYLIHSVADEAMSLRFDIAFDDSLDFDAWSPVDVNGRFTEDAPGRVGGGTIQAACPQNRNVFDITVTACEVGERDCMGRVAFRAVAYP